MPVAFLLAVIVLCAGAAAAQDAPRQVLLPKGLVEISGLAAASDTTVFAHNDEFAIVYEVDISNGEPVRAFALGDPTKKGDFEGIAVYDGRIYLVTSTGLLFEAEIGEHRDRVRYNIYDTGAGDACEVEGLSRAPAPGEFFVLCKRSNKRDRESQLVIFRWSLNERMPQTSPALAVNFRDFLPSSERDAFRPAGIEWDAETKSIWIVSSRSRIVYVFDENGRFKRRIRLSQSMHAQSEGITVTPSGAVLIADEGATRGAGAITVYDYMQ